MRKASKLGALALGLLIGGAVGLRAELGLRGTDGTSLPAAGERAGSGQVGEDAGGGGGSDPSPATTPSEATEPSVPEADAATLAPEAAVATGEEPGAAMPDFAEAPSVIDI